MRECKGVVWGFSWLGATCWRFCRKTQKEPAKCLYSVMCTVYSVLLSPLWLKSVPGWPAISVSTWQQSRVGQIVWFGSLSAISQLASRGGGMGSWATLCLHSVTQPYTTCPRWREQWGGLRSLPLSRTHSTSPHLKLFFFLTPERNCLWKFLMYFAYSLSMLVLFTLKTGKLLWEENSRLFCEIFYSTVYSLLLDPHLNLIRL